MLNKCSKLSIFKHYIIYCVSFNCVSDQDGPDPADVDGVDHVARDGGHARRGGHAHRAEGTLLNIP